MEDKLKKVMAGLLLAFSLNAAALEMGGVRIAEQAQVAGQTVRLNGAGVRTFLFMDMYVAALYLPVRQTTGAAVLAEQGARRIALHVLQEAPVSRFLGAFRKGMEKNVGEQALPALASRMTQFEHLFDGVAAVKGGAVIAFDGVPGEGLRASLDGRELGRIAGDDFYRALLSIWLGEHPVQGDLKQGLLGG
jgi:hypothetical protein